VGTAETEGFRIYVVVRDPRDGKILDTLPPLADTTHLSANPELVYTWKGWEEPTYHLRLKRSYFIVRDRFAKIPQVMTR